MIRKIVILSVTAMMAYAVSAQNPIIRNMYSADPTARVFNGRMYVYPSHDIVSPVEPEKKNSYAMWAPDCVEKNGCYYFYFPAAPSGERRGFGVGVAIALRPEGPFSPMCQPIEGLHGIDPCVLIDPKDGKAYIYWAGMGMWMARLKDNMMELDTRPEQVKTLPDGFKEGPFVFERQGKYYYTFPWVRDTTETLAYAMGDSPMGPFEFKGVIMEESPTKCWTNHHSIVEYQKQWYLFYHHNDYSPEFDKLRSVRCDSLFFNPDGTIRPVVPTLRGVGITSARNRIEIDRYHHISHGAYIKLMDESKPFEGWATVFPKKGASVDYSRVDFGTEAVGEMVIRVKSNSKAGIMVRANGALVTSVNIPKSSTWTNLKVSVKHAPKGVNDINVTLTKGEMVEIDYIAFDTD